MSNLIDYIAWRGDIPFSQCPFNEIDALVLCQLSYCNLDNVVTSEFSKKQAITLREAACRFAESENFTKRSDVGAMINPLTIALLQSTGESARYGCLKMCGFVNKIDSSIDEQFSAVTFFLPDHTIFIAYRGTDDTIVGWKEDFDMGWKKQVPAQTDGTKYLQDAAKAFWGYSIMTGGHSKGGNVAIYGPKNSPLSLRKRIKAIFNFDGPGFSKEFMASQEYVSLRDRVYSFKPQGSLVGIIFEHDRYVTVESDGKGVMQHDPFTWHVEARNFVELPDLDEDSKVNMKIINDSLSELSEEQTELFVNTVFNILKSTASTNTQLKSNPFDSVGKIWGAASKLDSKTRDTVWKCLQVVLNNGWISYRDAWGKKSKQKTDEVVSSAKKAADSAVEKVKELQKNASKSMARKKDDNASKSEKSVKSGKTSGSEKTAKKSTADKTAGAKKTAVKGKVAKSK